VGGALGLAVLATLAGARTLNLVDNGASSAAALAGGYHLAWLVGSGTVVITIALAMSVLRVRTSIEDHVTFAEGDCAA
jgi:hypothetical protein